MKDDNFVGAAEIASIMGVSRQRVHQLAEAHKDFPVPVAELTAGRIWRRGDIERWLKEHPQRRPGRPVREERTK